MPSNNGGVIGNLNSTFTTTVYSRFDAPGTFTPQVLTATVTVIGGGGAGGDNQAAGGGAGGMVLTPSSFPLPGSPITVTIGAGGPNAAPTPASSSGRFAASGTDTTFGSLLTGKGGGGAGDFTGDPPPQGSAGLPGGSGGGARKGESGPKPAGTATQPAQPGNSGTYGFGNPGGPGQPTDSGVSGGGGGAGGAGTQAGAGGAAKSISPSYPSSPAPFIGPGSYAEGGFGTGGPTTGRGGGSPPAVTPGAVNTGGGGGANGNGGSGLVLVQESNVRQAPGSWTLKGAFLQKKAGTWTGV